MDALLTKALEQGLGYALFVFLLFYVLREQAKRDKKSEDRESKYQDIIDKLTEKFGIISLVSQKVDKIEEKVDNLFKK